MLRVRSLGVVMMASLRCSSVTQCSLRLGDGRATVYRHTRRPGHLRERRTIGGHYRAGMDDFLLLPGGSLSLLIRILSRATRSAERATVTGTSSALAVSAIAFLR